VIPEDLYYSAEHEWATPSAAGTTAGAVRIGITDFAQNALGDVVYVQLPELGSAVTAGEPVGEVESTKSVSELFTPLSGTVTAVNTELESSPELVNSDPYGAGWIYELEPDDPSALADLLDAAGYAEVIGE
jgi:glycine cleavage system H protein